MNGEKTEYPTIQEIQQLTECLRLGNYDPEGAHSEYERILERFILSIDVYLDETGLLSEIKKLIEARQGVTFWYA